jgi:2,4-dienoyl-CoA reductase (NADPH2)
VEATRELYKLFQPIKIGSLELPNRIVMPAITTNYDFENNDRISSFYSERANGGAALIILGALQTLYPGRRSHIGRVNLHADASVPELRKWTNAIHKGAGRVAAQLATYGYWAKNGQDCTAEDVGPTEVTIPTAGLHPTVSDLEFLPKARPLTLEEIMMIEEAIGDASLRAQDAGFDAIELQVAAGNLLCRFVSPFTNRRTDEYGGSVENRTRIIVRAIENIKKKVGNDFPVICRIPGMDMIPWDIHLDGWKEVAQILEKAGVHALSIYPGWHDSRVPRHQMCVPRGGFVYLAEAIKKVVDIPIATNIRINDPILAEDLIAKGKSDLIAMGTPLIADPFFPKKTKEGRIRDIRMCTACCNCWDDFLKGQPIRCSVNARAGREAEYVITPAKMSRKILIIGGGPAGLEAARVSALRGHRVTLFEKRQNLGGQLQYALVGPHKEEWYTLIEYYRRQMCKLSVEMKLNEAFTIEALEVTKPDAVIVATGAVPLIPEVSGVNGTNVATAIEVLSGKKKVGENVAVIGGGAIGCETAEFLYRQGRKVTIVEKMETIGFDIGAWNRWVVVDRLRSIVRIETNAEMEEITERGVRIGRAGKHREFFEADTVVLAVGMKAFDDITIDLEGKIPSLYKAGDCIKPRKVRDAVTAGFLVAMEI